jgi:hypothetical protein
VQYRAFERFTVFEQVMSSPCALTRSKLSARCTATDVNLEVAMPEKRTIERARKDKREGKSASTQAGEFIREEIHHIREGKHGARSTKQAIAIGISTARRAGVKLPAPKKGEASAETRRTAKRDLKKGRKRSKRVSARRSRASLKRLRRYGRSAVSKKALSRQARSVAEPDCT